MLLTRFVKAQLIIFLTTVVALLALALFYLRLPAWPGSASTS